jgi:hypothetical protein
VFVTPGTQMLVSVHHPNGAFGYRVNGFRNRTLTSNSGCMSAPASSAASPNGMYKYTQDPNAAPDLSYEHSEYFITPALTVAPGQGGTTTTTTLPTTTTTLPTTTTVPAVGERLYGQDVVPPSSLSIGASYPVVTGQRVSFTCNGRVRGVWWYRTAQDTGLLTASVRVGSSSTIVATGSVQVAPGSGSGWVFVPLSQEVVVAAGSQMLTTVHHPNGAYGYRMNGFRNRAVSSVSGCMTSPASSAAVPNGLYKYASSPSALPDLSYEQSEYFISPEFVRNP